MCSQSHWSLQKKRQRMNWRTWYASRDDEKAFFYRRFRLQRSDSRKKNSINRKSCNRILRSTDFNFEKIVQKNEWIKINVWENWTRKHKKFKKKNDKKNERSKTRWFSHVFSCLEWQKWVFSNISSNRLS